VKGVVDQEHQKAKNFHVYCTEDEVYDFKMNEDEDTVYFILWQIILNINSSKSFRS